MAQLARYRRTMTVHPKIRMTVEQYLAWAVQQPGRWELVDGEPVRMAPERAIHNRVKALVFRALDDAVIAAGLDCEVFTDGMTVMIDPDNGKPRCYEPDAAVQCGMLQDVDAMILTAPMIVVEVLSPSSARVDASSKLTDYFKVPSIQHYLIVARDDRRLIHHRREQSHITTLIIETGPVRLDPPGLRLDIGDFWPMAR